MNRRQDKRQRSVECAKQGGGKVAKGGVKKAKVVHNDRRRLETHGLGRGNVAEGCLGSYRGVGPSTGSALMAEKQVCNRPQYPKFGSVGAG